MLDLLKAEAQQGYTENGALTYTSSGSWCLDLFAAAGALRGASRKEIAPMVQRAYAENPSLALKIVFYARDVREGLGERQFFRTALGLLAEQAPEAVRRNLDQIAELGRYDDLFCLWDTPCQEAMTHLVKEQLQRDFAAHQAGEAVSLLAKWMPSVNASSPKTVSLGKRWAKALGLSQKRYRKLLAVLRADSGIIENYLRQKDYTFDYAKLPAQAMFKYRQAFGRGDASRYAGYLEQVKHGQAVLKTGTLYPYEIIRPCFKTQVTAEERQVLEATWQSLPDYAAGENALVVMDGSGSMYSWQNGEPAMVALSLAIYFAQRAKGVFHNHFITFSEHPRLVEVKGQDIWEQVRYCATFNEAANTDLQAVFTLLLRTACKHRLTQADLPQSVYVVSDMEFDGCAANASVTHFEQARERFAQAGYQLPKVVFWNVASHQRQQPVRQNEQGAVLVSGLSPKIFELTLSGETSPYAYMLSVLGSKRYADIGI